MKKKKKFTAATTGAFTLCAGLIVSVGALPKAAVAQPAAATKDQTIEFSIPAGSLSAALLEFSEKSGQKVLFNAELVRGLKIGGLKGRFSPKQALQRLLSGTGLSYHSTSTGSITLERQSEKTPEPKPQSQPQSQPQSSGSVLPTITVIGNTGPGDNDPYKKDYTVTHSSVATRTDTPLMETPVSIQVISRPVIQDQKVPLVKDALENVSGVRPSQSLTPTGNSFIIRGFPNGGRVYRNGLLSLGGYGGASSTFDTANLESVEVMKGPASVLYGRIEPGGLINVTNKRPLAESFYALEQQFGSYDYYRTLWDATGAVVQDGSLLYRFSGAYQNNKSFRDFTPMDRVLVSPSFTWRPTKATELNVNLELFNQNYKADFGIPVIGDRPAPIPISRSLGDPNTPMSENINYNINTTLTHHFNDDWTLHQRFLASYEDANSTFVNPSPAFGDALQADYRTLTRNVFFQYARTTSYNTNIDLTGKFNLWETRHEVLAGFDYARGDTQYSYRGDYLNPDPALTIDIFNPYPSYGIPKSVFSRAMAIQGAGPFTAVARNDWYGVYFQDQITLWDKLHILGGGRYDWAQSGSAYMPTLEESKAALSSNLLKNDRFNPRVGILYQPWQWLSVYGSWTNSLGANNGLSASGRPQPPEIGEQYEAGVKTELFDGRLNSTLAYYHLTKQNILTPDLTNPFFTKAVGEARSQGIELDVNGKITENLNIVASYAYTDSRITKDNSGLQGNRMSNVPEHSGSLWLKYEVKDYAPLEGLSFGIGTFLASKREGDVQNTFLLPGYVRVDGFAAYRWNMGPTRVTAQFNVRNLLDKQYYESTDPNSNVAPRLGVYPGAPLTLLGSLRVEY